MESSQGALAARLRTLMLDKGVRTDPETELRFYTGYQYGTLYDWDLYFETLTLYYLGETEYARNGVRLFLSTQRDSGFIPRVFQREQLGWRAEEDLEHCKPFLAQTALLASRYDGDFEWITPEMRHKLRKYVNYWLDDCDRDGNGLSEWNSGPHCGEDNQFERAGGWQANFCEGVDLNSFLVRECQALAILMEQAGDIQQAKDLREAARARKDAIQRLLWDSNEECFFDRHRRTGKLIPVKYAMAFATLWADVATPHQAASSVKRHLLNPGEFWAPHPVATYARTEPMYSQEPREGDYSACTWRGSLWIPANYIIMQGLRRYGFREEAAVLADRSYAVLAAHEHPYEFYNAETGAGCGQGPFWGWSGLAAFMLLEIEHDCDPTALDATDLKKPIQAVQQAINPH